MPKVDFDQVPDSTDFNPIPEGDYLCTIDSVEKSETRHGDEMWKIRLAVLDGEHKGRFIFDNLPFSARGLPRVKAFCAAIGVDISGTVELTPTFVENRTCIVSVEIEDYIDRHGNAKQSNSVLFDGYSPVNGQAPGLAVTGDVVAEPVDPKDVPF